MKTCLTVSIVYFKGGSGETTISKFNSISPEKGSTLKGKKGSAMQKSKQKITKVLHFTKRRQI